jgi:uncharacterized protein with HEPN domain
MSTISKPRKLTAEQKASVWTYVAKLVERELTHPFNRVDPEVVAFAVANVVPALRKRAANIRKRGTR